MGGEPANIKCTIWVDPTGARTTIYEHDNHYTIDKVYMFWYLHD